MAYFHVPNPLDEAKKAVEHVIKPARDAAKKVVDKAGEAALGAISKARKACWDKVVEWTKRIEHAGSDAVKAVGSAATEAEGKLGHIAHDAEDAIGKAARDAKGEVEDAVDKLQDHASEAVSEAFDALARAVTEHGLSIVKDVVSTTHDKLTELSESKPGLVDAINDLGGQVEIGPLTLSYANFYTRTELVAGVLDQYINEPPELRRGPIIDMVRALGPDSIDLGISVQVVALVVGSKELGVGGGLNDVSIDLFAELGDVILEAMGVPE